MFDKYNVLLNNYNCFHKLRIKNKKEYVYVEENENGESHYLDKVVLSFSLKCENNEDIYINMEAFSSNTDTLNTMVNDIELRYFSNYDTYLISKQYLKKQTKEDFSKQLSTIFFKKFSEDILVAIEYQMESIRVKTEKSDSWK
jgi:hypothetical protein